MSKKISGAEYPLAKIFSSDFDYAIPSYQRPYAWTEVQAGDLFADLYDFFIKEQEDTYFLGSIVLIKEEGKPYAEVIDGQQRLTTLTILLAALTQLSSGSIREAFHRYLCEPGNVLESLPQKPRLTLRERDRAFFEKFVQGIQLTELIKQDAAQLDNESQRNIMQNAKLFLDKLAEKFDKNQDMLTKFGGFLVQRCFLVAVSTPSQQSAFRVFSVLNSRGLDLLPTDIIKSDIIGNIKSQDKQNEVTERWEELEVQTGRDGFAELFTHIRMIFAKEKARRSLLEEFREQVIKKFPSAENLMATVIEPFAEAYLIAKKCQYLSTTNAADINGLLKWLNRIENSDWLPSAIRFLADQGKDAEYVLWFFKKLERLASFMHICGYDVNKRMERYALVLSELESTHDGNNPISSVELTDLEKAEMLQVLDGDIYLMTARRRNHLLLRLDAFLGDGAASYDIGLLTVEHVLPQTVSAESEWQQNWPDESLRKQWVHRLANLLPLNQKRNSQAQNYDFDRKKSAYFGGKSGISSYVMTTQVLSIPEWTPEIVKQRQFDLIQLLTAKWELMPSSL
ncbi:DUF262 domain-containing protein [Undibacterium sp. CY21W]|uniref:DUF262 domain-containing protein n=1 Tax=Undibacterium sp. CY21W TaxID=2762293 RepID=UPI00164B482E|nr:DUF262 domain-containing protein [Undibacterium sp. CY21W]MBC3929215.1 DUF262 domain-containing protein [Undibacterium sp. CY21W]